VSEVFDQAAFGDQIRLHGKLFYRVAYQILRNSALAEEACQQGLCNTWQHRASLQDPAAIRAWLVRAIVHESLQMLRRGRIEKRALERKAAEVPRPGEDAHLDLEQRESVVAALAMLPDPGREVLVLRVMHGMSGNAVAELLGITPVEVSRRLHGAMQIVREQFSESAGVFQKQRVNNDRF
jgi:RNA polymerase sigma-70 factor (ECF subfamily)